ncbi:unnamed protein product [Rotaria socialis]|uniref:Mitochondrial ATPase inhibitor n=1 Tax=Rotaria socialis TaxID=392032 RepID=A0A817XZX7_9BILA|nr:unnamed protein product [Rotaria socialis]CAF3373052.1 unnamed protein product [Rotaria socialis]CAF3433352.1 unnamed protein product [Rotaria socialis]CAF3457715.1 unnamed protein product [Rotaria socialis]CAF4415076.1 unnamed protein product [Rotaria socialis]
MLRICANLLKQRTSQVLVSTRLTSTDPSSGSINAAHDKFSEREKALENSYFRKQNDELMTKLRKRHSELEKQSDDIEQEQEKIEAEIKKLEKQREELAKKTQKQTKK